MPPARKPIERSIAMWGPPSSGKTTFLAALSIALTRQKADWRLRGADPGSEEILVQMTKELARDQIFPLPTDDIQYYRWVVERNLPVKGPRLFRGRSSEAEISLNLVDASGEISDPERMAYSVRQDLIEDLIKSSGIIYIFDPMREFREGDAFDHTYGMLVQLARLKATEPGWNGGRLPHYVAVCVTKFDEIPVYEAARKLSLVVSDPNDPYDFPHVHNDDARELFSKLCETSGSGNAEMVINALEQYFWPGRIKYFVTSAIGFYLNQRTRFFDEDDWQNVVPSERRGDSTERKPGEKRPRNAAKIRGGVYPINVVEPVAWLCERILNEPARPRNATR